MKEEKLVTNKIGRKFWIYKNDTFYQQRIANAGPYQKHNLIKLRALVPNARTILDVGMNIGMNTIEYATWAKQVHGFEPTKQTYNMAVKNIDMAKAQSEQEFHQGWFPTDGGWASCVLTGNIKTYNCGIGDKPDKLEILIKNNNAGHNHFENIHIPTKKGKTRIRKVEPEKEVVDVFTIDSFNFSDVDAIKIDTEGFEFFVIQGAEKTITQQQPVIQVELIADHCEAFGYTCQDVYDWFSSRGFISMLSDGTLDGDVWHYVPKKTERFFIHKSKMPVGILDDVL